MRGFRGSRAAQNLQSSPGGRGAPVQIRSSVGAPASASPFAPSSRPPLPDWLKTPETRAREQTEASRVAGSEQPRLRVVQAAPTPSVPESPSRKALQGAVQHRKKVVSMTLTSSKASSKASAKRLKISRKAA